ncbi:MAG: hypothetical protein BMS9Abin25_1320 [Gammaproteobacteria bacterium]|nr:MAG: hypothetical protein BMS9Abin25_1320 [Gammaproteobacteria bacterium]
MKNNMNFYFRKTTLSVFLLTLFPVMAVNAVETALDPGFSGKGITYGPRAQAIGQGASSSGDKNADDDGSGTFFYPAVGVGVSTDDNINRTPANVKSATIYHLRPALGVQSGKNSTRFNAGYAGDYAKYTGTNLDDLYSYEDHHLYAGVTGYGKKSGYNVTADYTRGHDSVSGNSINDNLRRFDTWDRYSLLASTDLGARGARVNLRLDGLLENKRQDLLKSIDYDTAALGAMLKLRLGGKTYGVLEGGWRNWDYLNSNADADRYYGRVGVSWEATAKTKGLLTYGTEKYNPDNPGVPIVSSEFGPTFGSNEKTKNSTWQGGIDWEIRRRDLLRFGTYKGARNSQGTGSHSISTRYTIGWTHDWSERIRSNLGYMTGTEDYKGTDRNDDLLSYNFDLSYKFHRNMLLRGYYIFDDLDSNVELVSYDRNRAGFFFEWEL